MSLRIKFTPSNSMHCSYLYPVRIDSFSYEFHNMLFENSVYTKIKVFFRISQMIYFINNPVFMSGFTYACQQTDSLRNCFNVCYCCCFFTRFLISPCRLTEVCLTFENCFSVSWRNVIQNNYTSDTFDIMEYFCIQDHPQPTAISLFAFNTFALYFT